MSDEKTTGADLAEQLDDHQAEPEQLDEKDAELAKLRAELDGLKNPPPTAEPEPDDPRDRVLAQLRAELAAVRSTPEGAAAEMAKALEALRVEVDRMKSGTGLVPVPESGEPDPYLYSMRLACGDTAETQHPNGTHHHCDTHGTVPIEAVWPNDHLMYVAA